MSHSDRYGRATGPVVMSTRTWAYAEHVSRGEGPAFIDPLPALQKEYEAAVERLRRETGDPRTLRQKWRSWSTRRRLWKDMVVKPRRAGNW